MVKAHNNLGMLIGALTGLSLLAWFISYQAGLATAYNDAMSILNLSRLVVDNIQPGFAQLGSVWLPLNKVLSLPLIWSDWAWHSGFAGSIVSMISYVVAAVAAYLSVKALTNNPTAALIGALAFALNLNLLYLQTTPLTEPLYLALFMLSVLFFIYYIKSHDVRYLPVLGILGGLQVLTRYDGWFVVAVEALLLGYYHFYYLKDSLQRTLGKTLLFAVPVAFAVFLWIIWNVLLYGDPLYFALGEHSARAQQDLIDADGGLTTKHSLSLSLTTYWYALTGNIGLGLSLFAIMGYLFMLLQKGQAKLSVNKQLLIPTVILLLAPILFNVLALYLGFSTITVPEMSAHFSDPSKQWFNVRYGIIGLPFIAIGIGLIAKQRQSLAIVCFAAILLQQLVLAQSGITTIIDGTRGTSAFPNHDLAQQLKTHVQPNEKVILAQSHFNPVAFKSGLPMQQFIHEGVNHQWDESLSRPEDHAEWIIMANYNIGEEVQETLVVENNGRFLDHYYLFYEGKHGNIYQLENARQYARQLSF